MPEITGTTKHEDIRKVVVPGRRGYACVAEIVGARRSVRVIPGHLFSGKCAFKVGNVGFLSLPFWTTVYSFECESVSVAQSFFLQEHLHESVYPCLELAHGEVLSIHVVRVDHH